MYNEALANLEIFDQELAKKGTPFFGGNKPGIVDLMIWPWCERADVIRIIRGEQFIIPRDRFLRLVNIILFKDDIIKNVIMYKFLYNAARMENCHERRSGSM